MNGRCPGSPMQACRVRTESGNSRTDVVKIVFDEYLDEKVTYDINTRYKCRIYVLSVFAVNVFLACFIFVLSVLQTTLFSVKYIAVVEC